MKLNQAENSVNALHLAAAGLARQAADAVDEPVLVAGPMGPTGGLFQLLGTFGTNCGIGPSELLDSMHQFKHREKTYLSLRKAIVAFLFMLMGRFIIMARLN